MANMTSKESGKKKYKTVGYFERRILLLFFIILFSSILIIFRLYNLQILSRDYYLSLAEGQHSTFSNLIPKRGEIFLNDKEGVYPVAVNKNTKLAFAVPKEVENPMEEAKIISEKLGLDREDVEKRLGKPNDMYEVLKHRLSEDEVNTLNDLKLKGIHLSDEVFRYYPAGELASQVLGFIGWKGNDFGGRYGIENYFNKELAGKEGELFQNKDNAGRWIPIGKKKLVSAKDGDDLVLTIDHIIQYETEKILKSAVKKFEADRGIIIVMDPPTGRILAMAGYPGFNPNDYKDSNLENFRNLVVSDSYECGSVFKTFTLASAIDDGKIDYNSIYTDTGSVREAGYTIQNSDFKANGVQTMTQVLEKSLNTGSIYAEKLLGNSNFSDYVKRFGFGALTDIDLPGESVGNISNLKNLKSNINFFTASFGQGITVTPIQLANAYNTIANGGVLMKPQIIEKVINSENETSEIKPQEVRKVISQDANNQITQMLVSVVDNGHGKQAGVPGYGVAGKTGTAQVANTDSKGYQEGKNIGSFVGFAPVDNPQFTVLVRMDNPKAVEWAESSAAPAFGELMKFLLDYKNIKPNRSYNETDLNKFKITHNLGEYYINIEKEEKEKEKEQQKDKAENENEKKQE